MRGISRRRSSLGIGRGTACLNAGPPGVDGDRFPPVTPTAAWRVTPSEGGASWSGRHRRAIVAHVPAFRFVFQPTKHTGAFWCTPVGSATTRRPWAFLGRGREPSATCTPSAPGRRSRCSARHVTTSGRSSSSRLSSGLDRIVGACGSRLSRLDWSAGADRAETVARNVPRVPRPGHLPRRSPENVFANRNWVSSIVQSVKAGSRGRPENPHDANIGSRRKEDLVTGSCILHVHINLGM